MIEIRAFDGPPEEAYQTLFDVWSGAFGGKFPIPIWSPEYLEWELLSTRLGGEDYLVAAYDNGELVGTLFAEEFTFQMHGEPVLGTNGSWLSVQKSYLGSSLAKRMWDVLRQRHLERGARIMSGWMYRDRGGRVGYQFWNANSKMAIIDEVGCWVRLIDHAAVARWEPVRQWAAVASTLGIAQSAPRDPANRAGVRAYRPEDIDACLHLVNELGARADVSFIWTRDRLAHQLQYKDMPRTLVLERDGEVVGLFNWHCIDVLGKHPLRTAMIDLPVLHKLTGAEQKRLVATALAGMRDDGAAMAVALRTPFVPWQAMIGRGFLPMPAQFTFGIIRADDDFPIEGVRTHFMRAR